MGPVDLTEAALEALQPPTVTTTKTANHAEAHRVRGKILGVLICMHRLEAERSLAECGTFMGTEPQLVEAWEYGDKVPSLPQLELLAHFLNGGASDSDSSALTGDRSAQREYLLLRRRLIGGMLRAARESMGRSIGDLSAGTGLEAARLERFEFGEEKIPVSYLTELAQAVEKDLSYFAAKPHFMLDQSPSANSAETRSDDDVEWRQFSMNSENRAFIRLAMAF
jgi:transcriptional regulator with XRE-family HTH domain